VAGGVRQGAKAVGGSHGGEAGAAALEEALVAAAWRRVEREERTSWAVSI
jgi:hypothetical protein